MSQIFREFNLEPIFDIFVKDSPRNDESIESENNFAISILTDKLFDNYKMSDNFDESNSSFYSENSSSISSLFKKEYDLKEKEQINEVKFNLFMIMNKNCSYNDKYNSIFSISQKDREIKLRRLVIQKMNISSDKNVIYENKNYIFFPLNKNNVIKFIYNIGTNKQFEININNKETIIKCDGNNLNNEDIFKEYSEIQENLKKEKKQIIKEFNDKRCPKQNKNDNENNAVEKQNSINVNNTQDDIKNKIIEQNEDIKGNNREFSLIDYESENEVKQKSTYYLQQEKNIFYKFCFCNSYKKEVDGIYTTHDQIDLKIKGIVEFESSIKDLEILEKNYNTDNDLKSYIIYKNFEQSIIEKNTAMFLEVKKGFDIFSLLVQIKQNAKILKNMYLEDKTIVLPNYIIGIMCNFNEKQALHRYQQLNIKDKGISILQHIMNIINETKINVLIGAIKDGKINKYDLNEDDCDINLDSGAKTNKRVDLSFLNRLALNNKYSDKQIEDFNIKLKDKYKSLYYEKKFVLNKSQFSSFSNEENKQLKQRVKELEEERKKTEEERKNMEEKLKKEMEEEKKKIEEKLKKEMEEEKKKAEEERKKIEEKLKKEMEEKKKMEEELKKEMELEKKKMEEKKKKAEEERKKIEEKLKKEMEEKKKMEEELKKEMELEKKKMEEKIKKEMEEKIKKEMEKEKKKSNKNY